MKTIPVAFSLLFCSLCAIGGDIDYDGVPDEADALPYDESEYLDTDLDGYGDNSDDFPSDPTIFRDADNDGVADEADESSPEEQAQIRAHLSDFYNSVGGSDWANNDGWLVDPDYCNWFGISCNFNRGKDQETTPLAIDLTNNNLEGQLTDGLIELIQSQTLGYLMLADNNLKGMVSQEQWDAIKTLRGVNYAFFYDLRGNNFNCPYPQGMDNYFLNYGDFYGGDACVPVTVTSEVSGGGQICSIPNGLFQNTPTEYLYTQTFSLLFVADQGHQIGSLDSNCTGEFEDSIFNSRFLRGQLHRLGHI